jgi:hypothetical protein
MMEKFSQILRRLSTTTYMSSSRNFFGGIAPFKVQVNFDIPMFEGQIDPDSLEKCLNMLEFYFSIHKFSIEKKSPLRSLRMSSMSKIGGRVTVSKLPQRSMEFSRPNSFEIFYGCN